ncbi:MAG TPA: RtcB family protein [Dehalococcoidales bacterium]|nr:RtcB family protein [Dehalococcoidales bacterium]
MANNWKTMIHKIDDVRWEIRKDFKDGMLVPGRVYASEAMLGQIWEDKALEQVVNVSFLPGIVGASMAMPDIHWGYGFAIGGVAATRVKDGVISPGGVGFDINCGVRALRTNLSAEEIRPRLEDLVYAMFSNIPSGLGSEGKLRISEKELDRVLSKGAAWAVENGFGEAADLIFTESNGCLKDADPDKVSQKAKKRGLPQIGTLGSGNHFLEIQSVDQIYDRETAHAMGILEQGQVLILIHTGSRGLGHQVCDDTIRIMNSAVQKYAISVPDRQLVCAPVQSPEGKDYLSAMACAANYAWANRQCITHWVRESFIKVLKKSPRELGLEQIYDIAHNIAKIEQHTLEGKTQTLCVHRKGATRAFSGGHPELPAIYRNIGQPVLIPGDMGRYSYYSVGTKTAMAETFGSTCHGAGRLQSRTAAKKGLKGSDIRHKLGQRGIIVKSDSMSGLAEEASEAYKDVSEVVEVTEKAGISRKVARAVPMGVIKG